ncbi:MAG: serine hydrolase domain-containing protein [Planctomycetota bacterium]
MSGRYTDFFLSNYCYGAKISARDDLAETLLAERFSGVVRIVYRGSVALQHVAGHTRAGSAWKVRADTRFATASVTKMFTAVCIARLAEQGLCRLDQPASRYVPAANCFGDTATLDALLSHRAGLGDYIDDDAVLPFAAFPVEQLTSVDAFLPYIFKVDRHTPGRFRYSSAGYVLLGAVIEAVTKQAYPQAVRSCVIEPAGLCSTSFGRVDDPSPDYAWGYLENGEPNAQHLPPVGGPDGGIVTTVEDLESFFAWLRGDTAWGDSMKRTMWERISETGVGEGYARGFDVMDIGGRPWVGHTGSDPGVSTRVMFDPASESNITVLCNRGSIAFRVFRLVRRWLDADGWPPNHRLQRLCLKSSGLD